MNFSQKCLIIFMIFLLALGGTLAKQNSHHRIKKSRAVKNWRHQPVVKNKKKIGPVDFYQGIASWYGLRFNGKPMACGQKFDMNNPRHAAHRTLRLGTKLEITNLANQKKLVVTVLDRGPFTKNKKGKFARDIDLSYAGARQLDFVDTGLARVKIKIIKNKNLRL